MSRNFNKPLKYRGYIRNPLTVSEIDNIYRSNNIIPARVDLYNDFVQSLCDLVFKTYLGDEHHIESEHRIEHFKWCWNKNLRVFKDMGYKFKSEKKKYDYFELFFLSVYYFVDRKDDELEEGIKNAWDFIFDYNVLKSNIDITNFLEIYEMFEETNWFK